MLVSQVSSDNTATVKSAYQAAPVKPVQSAAQPVRAATTSGPSKDTVELSGSALAQSLKSRGFSVEQIALQMGLDVNTVSTYLKISSKDEKEGQGGPAVKYDRDGVSKTLAKEPSLSHGTDNRQNNYDAAVRSSAARDQQLKSAYNDNKPVYEQSKQKTEVVERPGDARAKSLKYQGYSVAEISQRMGVDASTVKKYIHKV